MEPEEAEEQALSDTEAADGAAGPAEQAKKPSLLTWAWWKSFVINQFLLIGFAISLLVGLTWPWPGATLQSWKLGQYSIAPTVCIWIIFFISGLRLRTDDALAALRKPAGLVYGLVAILGITPMLGFAALEVPFQVQAFSTGLAIFCSVPTTLSSGVAMVTAASGNAALALMLTVASNLLGVVTVPFLLQAMLSTSAGLSLDAVALLLNLCVKILAPLVVGKVLREASEPVRNFAKEHKTSLGLVNNGALVLVVWQNVSRSREDIVQTPFLQIFFLILAGIVIHTIYLAVNFVACTLLRLPGRDYRAVLLVSSQKTLPVSVTLISYLDTATFGSQGLLTIPCIIGHMSQLFMDAFIVSHLASKPLPEEVVSEDGLDSLQLGSSEDRDRSAEPGKDAVELAQERVHSHAV